MTAPVAHRGELAPSTATGWARLRERLERDGALTARDKALVIVAVAAARGRDELLARELERLSDLGGAEMIFSCASVLTLARGREVADRLAAAAGIGLDWSSAAPTSVGEQDVERARAYFTPPTAGPPAPIALLAEHAPEVLVGYHGLRSGIYDEGTLEPRLVELALFAISAADYLPGHAAVHGAKALEAGAGELELVEAGLCAIPAAGMAAWLFAATVIDGLQTKGER
jgi:alkylhydroperoxidase/carboxymuconolactone decarboxylase family protein YurZ